MTTCPGSGDTSPGAAGEANVPSDVARHRRIPGPKKRVSSWWRWTVAEVAEFTTRVESAGRKPDRCIPAATVIPVLIYPRRPRGRRLAVGGVRIGENHRAQPRVGAGAVIVGDVRGDRRPPGPGEVTHSVMVGVDDAHARCERARAHGAGILTEPTDFEYGERRFTVQDPPATNGRSPEPSPTLPQRNGAGNPSIPSALLAHLETTTQDPDTRTRSDRAAAQAATSPAGRGHEREVRPDCRAGSRRRRRRRHLRRRSRPQRRGVAAAGGPPVGSPRTG